MSDNKKTTGEEVVARRNVPGIIAALIIAGVGLTMSIVSGSDNPARPNTQPHSKPTSTTAPSAMVQQAPPPLAMLR